MLGGGTVCERFLGSTGHSSRIILVCFVRGEVWIIWRLRGVDASVARRVWYVVHIIIDTALTISRPDPNDISRTALYSCSTRQSDRHVPRSRNSNKLPTRREKGP